MFWEKTLGHKKGNFYREMISIPLGTGVVTITSLVFCNVSLSSTRMRKQLC